MQCASSIATSAGRQVADLGLPVRVAQLLGGDEEELGPSAADLLQRLGLLRRGLVGADPHRPQLGPVALVERGDLVLLQGQQRRDHHGRAGDQARRDLVDRRLAGSGGQHHQGVAPFHHRPHGGELIGAQGTPVEQLARRAADLAGVIGCFHRSPEVPAPVDAETASPCRWPTARAGAPRGRRGRTAPRSAGRCWRRRPRRNRPRRSGRSSRHAPRRPGRRRTPP